MARIGSSIKQAFEMNPEHSPKSANGFPARLRTLVLAAANMLLGAYPLAVTADVIQLNPVADTFIIDNFPTNNAGRSEGFTVGRDNDGTGNIRRGLIRFDLSTVPPGSTVTSAILELTVKNVPSNGIDTEFSILRLLRDWGEGDKLAFRPGSGFRGEPATAGESSWNANLTGTENWSTPGALDDAAPTPSASTFVAGLGSYTWTNAGVQADVQRWVDQPHTNFGWLIVCEDELTPKTARLFGSREFTPNPEPPVLTVGFVASPQVRLSEPMAWAGSNFQFTVLSVANTTNIVEVSTDVENPTAWSSIGTVVPTNDTFVVTDTNASDAFRLYRVRRF